MTTLTDPNADKDIVEFKVPVRDVAAKYIEYVSWVKDNGIEVADDVQQELTAIATEMYYMVTGADPMDLLEARFYRRLLEPRLSVIGEFADWGIAIATSVKGGKYHFAICAIALGVEYVMHMPWTDEAIRYTGVTETTVQ